MHSCIFHIKVYIPFHLIDCVVTCRLTGERMNLQRYWTVDDLDYPDWSPDLKVLQGCAETPGGKKPPLGPITLPQLVGRPFGAVFNELQLIHLLFAAKCS